MKRTIGILLVMALLLAACSGSEPATTSTQREMYTSPNIDTSYEGALSARNQLTLGVLMLDEAGAPLTPEQAQELLPLWQALRSTSQSGGGSTDEVNALLRQIESALTAGQLSAIRDMQLTSTDMQEWAAANGVSFGESGGLPGSGQGAGRNMTDEERAARQAAEGRTPGTTGGGLSTAILDAVINLLEGVGKKRGQGPGCYGGGG